MPKTTAAMGGNTPLEGMNKEQLLAYALENQINVNYTATAEEILVAIKTAQGNGNTPPPSDPPSQDGAEDKTPTPPSEGKKRIKNVALKGKKINIGNGKVVEVSNEGIFEVDAAQAAKLLTIPGYEEV